MQQHNQRNLPIQLRLSGRTSLVPRNINYQKYPIFPHLTPTDFLHLLLRPSINPSSIFQTFDLKNQSVRLFYANQSSTPSKNTAM